MPINEKIKSIFIALALAFCTFIFGDFSSKFALFIASLGIELPLKDIINFIIIFAFYKILIANFKSPKEKTDINILLCAFFGVVFMAILLILTWAFLILSGIFTLQINFKPNWQTQISLGVILILFHATSEQLLLQKIVRPYLAKFFKLEIIMIIGAISFAFVQFLQSYTAPIYIINSLIIGGLFILIGNKYGIWGAVFAHGFWSWFELILMPNLFDFKLQKKAIFLIGNDSYGTYILSLFGIVLIFILLLWQRFSYKANYDTYKP